MTQTLTTAATLSLHLYGDMYTTTSSSATDSTFVTYDDVLVTSNTRGTVMTEDFEQGISAWAACSGNLALAGPSAAPDQWKRDVIYLGGEAIAEVDAAGVHELHNDHLGSPRMITNGATGAVEGRQVFGLYGEKLPNYISGYAPLTGYTGHLQQDPSGLTYMRGRFYSQAWHRFINSDQGVDSSTFNQMAYVGGSPFQATDPSGLIEREVYRCENGILVHRVWDDNGNESTKIMGSCGNGSVSLDSSAIHDGYSANSGGGIVFSFQSQASIPGIGYDSGLVTHYQFFPVDYEYWQDSAGKAGAALGITASVLENGSKVASVAKAGKVAGVVAIPITTAIDASNPNVSGVHATTNFAVGVAGFFIGGWAGGIISGVYSAVDNIYPGGWFGLMLTPTPQEAWQAQYMRYK